VYSESFDAGASGWAFQDLWSESFWHGHLHLKILNTPIISHAAEIEKQMRTFLRSE
jgi:hypothetical protein